MNWWRKSVGSAGDSGAPLEHEQYWSADADTLLRQLGSSRDGLSARGSCATAPRVRTEPGARAPAPDAHAGAGESDPKPAAAGAGLRRGGIGDDRRVGRCRDRRRDRARHGGHWIHARVPGGDGGGGPAGARADTSPRPSRRARGRCADGGGRAWRRGAAVGRQPGSRRRRHSRSGGLLRQRSGSDRRELSRRKTTGNRRTRRRACATD